ncbi:Uu.00g096650.m01.CDS01 [Anthostomella pinea]|uniref:Uu.00g096650.m01.CDS01 n=1 Tax=Anthostomella pinea TaxID=933095 RepID=A0AAI8VD89_9PEZI|nr:Uu.00g096650.m01.CDS01 [Anthostomella pinea]
MSTTVLTQTNWQQYATASVEQFAAQQGAVTPNSQAMIRLISSYDSVTFDFSDWTPEQLNEKTTSFFWGLKSGFLDISCYNLKDGNLTDDMHAASLAADSRDDQAGKDIICIHDWCVKRAKTSGSYIPTQRCFRFEQGNYAGPLPFPGLRVVGKALGDL